MEYCFINLYQCSGKMARFLLPLVLLLAISLAEIAIAEEKETINYRLPGEVKPEHYDITLAPSFFNFMYTGVSIITVKALKNTSTITLHSKDLDIQKIEVKMNNDILQMTGYEHDDTKEFLILKLKNPFSVGVTLTITIEYVGTLNDDLRGFYRSSYKNEEGKKRWLATTHFEPTGARRAYPCFDEPALKAKFKITIDLSQMRDKAYYTAISNKPGKEENNTKIFKFEETPEMSTYLVAFVVSEFKEIHTTDGSPQVSVWIKPDLMKDAEYAKTKGKEILTSMAKYVEVPYQLTKMDQVGIPDFSAGAMENWGIVTYRQNALVYNNVTSTVSKKQSVAGIIAHEFAHQWFGNQVGPNWWRDLWLNEGFATFFQFIITDEVETSFKMQDQFVVNSLQDAAFNFDVIDKIHAMNVDVGSPKEISKIFDSISYQKSACVIRMMKHFLTEKVFKDGLTNYLTKKENKDATSNELFDYINEKWTDKGDKSLKNIMDNWVNKPGYPIITVKRNYDKKTVDIEQKRFLPPQSKELTNVTWTIPINFASQEKAEEDFKKTDVTNWIEAAKTSLNLSVDPKHWLIFNKQQTGYYRVNYDEQNWRLIINYLTSKTDNKNNLLKIHYLNRAQLVDDSWMLARTGVLNFPIVFDLTNYLSEEIDYFPWVSAIRHLKYLKNLLTHSEHYENFRKYGLKISQKLIDDVKFEHQDMDEHVQILKRSLALDWACSLGHENCVKEMESKFSSWLNSTDKKNINPNLEYIILSQGVRKADQTVWTQVFDQYKKETDESKQLMYLKALGQSRDEKILNNYLNLAIKKDSGIHNSFEAIRSVYEGNEIGLNVSMKFIFRQKTAILEQDKGEVKNLLKYIDEISQKLSTENQINTLQNYLKEDESLDQTELNTSINKAKENIEWVKKYGGTIGNLLVEKTNKNSATSLNFIALFSLIPLLISLLL